MRKSDKPIVESVGKLELKAGDILFLKVRGLTKAQVVTIRDQMRRILPPGVKGMVVPDTFVFTVVNVNQPARPA